MWAPPPDNTSSSWNISSQGGIKTGTLTEVVHYENVSFGFTHGYSYSSTQTWSGDSASWSEAETFGSIGYDESDDSFSSLSESFSNGTIAITNGTSFGSISTWGSGFFDTETGSTTNVVVVTTTPL